VKRGGSGQSGSRRQIASQILQAIRQSWIGSARSRSRGASSACTASHGITIRYRLVLHFLYTGLTVA
jgi:hypothetical protein